MTSVNPAYIMVMSAKFVGHVHQCFHTIKLILTNFNAVPFCCCICIVIFEGRCYNKSVLDIRVFDLSPNLSHLMMPIQYPLCQFV